MDTADSLMRHALARKRQRRHALAALPYAEKLRVLLRMQRMADAIRRTRGAPPRAWPISEDRLLPLEGGVSADRPSAARARHLIRAARLARPARGPQSL